MCLGTEDHRYSDVFTTPTHFDKDEDVKTEWWSFNQETADLVQSATGKIAILTLKAIEKKTEES